MGVKSFSPEFAAASVSIETDYRAAFESVRHETGSRAKDIVGRAELLRRLGQSEAAHRELILCSTWDPSGWVQWALGNVCRQRGDLLQAETYYRSASMQAVREQDSTLNFYARAGFAETLRVRGNFTAATSAHLRLLCVAQGRRDVRGIVWAKEGLAQIYRNTGRYLDALRLFQQSAQIAHESEDARGLGYALRGSGDALSLLGMHYEGIGLIRRAAALFEAAGAKQSLAYVYKAESDALLRANKILEAEEPIQRAEELFRGTGDLRGLAFIWLNRGRMHIFNGEWDAAAQPLSWSHDQLKQQRVMHGLMRASLVTKEWAGSRPKVFPVGVYRSSVT